MRSLRWMPCLAIAAALCAGFAAPAQAAHDWPNPFKWFKKKAPPPPPVVVPPPPVVVPPPPPHFEPPAPPKPHFDPPAPPKPHFEPPHPPGWHADPGPPQGNPNPPPSGGQDNGGQNPQNGPPSQGEQGNPPTQGGPGEGQQGNPPPSGPAHVHLFREVPQEVVEPARYEKVQVGVDKFGVPQFETRMVSPERKVIRKVKKCSCGATAP